MELLDDFPYAKATFITWFTNKYSLQIYMFENAPLIRQCEAISRCFGYQVEFDQQWTESQVLSHVKNILYLYEQVMIKYSGNVPDLIKELKEMDFAERIKILPDLMKPAEISHSFTEAMIELDNKSLIKQLNLSLRDALVILAPKLLQEPITTLNNEWTNESFNQNEKAPF